MAYLLTGACRGHLSTIPNPLPGAQLSSTTAVRDSTVFIPNLEKIFEREEPTFECMKIGVLYFPSDIYFPFVDLYYKTVDDNGNVRFVGIQCSCRFSDDARSRKGLGSRGTLEKLKAKLDIPVDIPFELLYCPHPKFACVSTYTLTDKLDDETLVKDKLDGETLFKSISVSILEVPQLNFLVNLFWKISWRK